MLSFNIMNLILRHYFFISFIYFLLIIFQLIWLYYEFTLINIILFFGNKVIIIISLLLLYFLEDSAYGIFFYIFGIIALIEIIEKRYKISYKINIDDIFLEDVLFIVASTIIIFYLM